MILRDNNDPRLLPDVYNTLKQHLDKLKSEYEKIPKPSSYSRENDLIDIKIHWIQEKMKMVNLLLHKIPDDDIAALRANARKEPAREVEITIDAFPPHEQLGGRRCKRSGKKRTGRKLSGKKRGRRTNKKRKSTTRRK